MRFLHIASVGCMVQRVQRPVVQLLNRVRNRIGGHQDVRGGEVAGCICSRTHGFGRPFRGLWVIGVTIPTISVVGWRTIAATAAKAWPPLLSRTPGSPSECFPKPVSLCGRASFRDAIITARRQASFKCSRVRSQSGIGAKNLILGRFPGDPGSSHWNPGDNHLLSGRESDKRERDERERKDRARANSFETRIQVAPGGWAAFPSLIIRRDVSFSLRVLHSSNRCEGES
jgi:hypothetical protein